MPIRLVVADDHLLVREGVRRLLETEPDIEVAAVCDDLTGRGFTAVETYPEIGARPDATSAATPGFWESVGFELAIADERFPVMRRALA